MALDFRPLDVDTQARRAERRTTVLVVAFLSVAVALLVFSESVMPNESLLSLVIMVMGLVAVFDYRVNSSMYNI